MDREDALDEATALFRMGSEACFADDHRVTDGPLGDVIGRFHVLMAHKSPEAVRAFEQLFARAAGLGMGHASTLDEQLFDFLFDLAHERSKCGPIESAHSQKMPPSEHAFGLGDEAVSDSLGITSTLGDFLKVAQEMCRNRSRGVNEGIPSGSSVNVIVISV